MRPLGAFLAEPKTHMLAKMDDAEILRLVLAGPMRAARAAVYLEKGDVESLLATIRE